jgi:hypothetical protein
MALAYGPARTEIRDGIAEAHLAACREIGSTIGLTNPGDAEIILWAMMDKDNTAPQMASGLVVEPEIRTFEIPRQSASVIDGTGAFTGKIQENAQIRWIDQVTGGDAFYIVKAGSGGWDMSGLEAIYNVRAVMTTVRRSGP